ncbi:hypothetical protein RUND412_005367 [Rhizina undulata]
MGYFPAEIVLEILSYVSERDLGSLRLVNHFFLAIANERYFQTIRVPFTNAVIELLVHLSLQPHLAKTVQHFIYPFRLPVHWHDPAGVVGYLPACEDGYWERRLEFADLDSSDVFRAVKFALSKMPNIGEITANLDGTKHEHDFDWPETSIIKDDRNFYIMECMNHREGDSENFESLWKDAMRGRIFKFLSSAPKLETLSLGIDWGYLTVTEIVTAVISLAKIFGDKYVWKHLETFCFNGGPGPMDGEELMHFVARHSTTLKTFGLYHPHLEMGTWREVFDVFMQQPELCLENLNILKPSEEMEDDMGRRIYWRDDDRKKMNEYVLRSGPPFPFTQAELERKGLKEFHDEEEFKEGNDGPYGFPLITDFDSDYPSDVEYDFNTHRQSDQEMNAMEILEMSSRQAEEFEVQYAGARPIGRKWAFSA